MLAPRRAATRSAKYVCACCATATPKELLTQERDWGMAASGRQQSSAATQHGTLPRSYFSNSCPTLWSLFFRAPPSKSEHSGKLNLHRYGVVQNVDGTGYGLAHRVDCEDEAISVPTLPASASDAGNLMEDLRKTSVDTPTRLGTAEFVRDAYGDAHVPSLPCRTFLKCARNDQSLAGACGRERK